MLDALIRTHRDPDELDFVALWKEGLFVFDSNVLLDLYRLPESASQDLIGVLKNSQLQPRIWIGFQVIVEFLNNRHETIGDQKNKFSSVRSLLAEASGAYDEVFKNLLDKLAKLKLKQRHSLIDPDKFLTSDRISEGKRTIEGFIQELSVLEGKQSDVNDRDLIKDVVLDIFRERIGEGFSQKELEDIYKLGEKRYERETPPGYEDKSKKGAYLVGDRELVRKYGDLVLWKEVIRKAKTEGIRSVVLVTGDVKEDWWLEKRGKRLGPRRELLNEIFTEAECVQNFYMYDTASFLKYSKTYLQASVLDTSITQAEDLIEKSRQRRVVSEEGYILLPDLLRSTAMIFPRLRVGLGESVRNLPPIRIDERALFRCLAEIYDNVVQHGAEPYVGVQAKNRGDMVVLRFKNRCTSDSRIPMVEDLRDRPSSGRSRGLIDIREDMLREGVSLAIVKTEKSFVVELSIHRSKLFEAS